MTPRERIIMAERRRAMRPTWCRAWVRSECAVCVEPIERDDEIAILRDVDTGPIGTIHADGVLVVVREAWA